MQLVVLGPVALVSAGSLVPVGGPKQRLVLGLLAAARGRMVPIDDLIDGLWPDGPQAQPRKTVQVYVTRLRRALADRADALRSEAAGYVLDRELLDVDADHFEREMRDALAATSDEDAAAGLRTALGRWRGDAFVDLRECAAILPAAVRLDGQRLTALRELFDREIRLRPHSVVGELEHVSGLHPLDETFAAQLMTAQYHSGRQADALATYQQVRRRLGDELGVEPGPVLRELHGRIVRHELVSARAASTFAEPAQQRRRVTIVAVGFQIDAGTGEEPDPEEEFALVAPLRQVARSRVASHGGVVVNESGDSLTASFGYPSRGDAPVQAVAAALSIRDLSAGADKRLTVQLGVETGLAVVEADRADGAGMALTGITGPPLRAARSLRDAADAATVRLGAAISQLVGREYELDAVVGSDTTVAVRRRPHPMARTPTRLLGRDGAVAAVLDVVETGSAGVRTVAVAGPPGIGKTSVVEAAAAQLDAEWAVVRLAGDRVHGAGDLQPFRRACPELFEGGAAPSTKQVIDALLRRWDQRRRVLIVDDLDALDPATFELLDSLADHVADVAVVVTVRDRIALELAGAAVPVVQLRPLDHATARAIARQAAGERGLDLAALNEIADRSGGNPWHVLELTAAALDRDRGDGVPTSLYDSLTWRLDRLGPRRHLAQRCSVLGGSFTAADALLIAGSDSTPADVRDALSAMVTEGILIDDGDDQLRFAHALVAEIAYESLLQAERADLHARIADDLAARGRAAEPAVLAYHLEASGRAAEAAEAWRRASSVAMRRSRNVDAQHHARRALRIVADLVASDGDSPALARLRQRALLNQAFGMQATHHGSDDLAAVIAQARTAGALPAGEAVMLDMIDVSNRQALGDFEGAAEIARATVTAFDDGRDPMSAAFAHQFLGATLVWTGDLADGGRQLGIAAEYWNSDAASDVGRLGARPLGALWALLGLVACFEDQPAATVGQYVDRATATIPDDDGDGRCLVAATAALIDQLAGRTDEVRTRIDPVWPLAMDLGSEFWLRWAQALLGWALAEQDGPSGRAMIAEVVDSQPVPQTKPYFSYLLGSRLGEAGLLDDADRRLADGVAVAVETGEALWLPLLELEQARWKRAAGDGATAVEWAASATDRARRMGIALVVERSRAWGLVPS